MLSWWDGTGRDAKTIPDPGIGREIRREYIQGIGRDHSREIGREAQSGAWLFLPASSGSTNTTYSHTPEVFLVLPAPAPPTRADHYQKDAQE